MLGDAHLIAVKNADHVLLFSLTRLFARPAGALALREGGAVHAEHAFAMTAGSPCSLTLRVEV